MMSRFALIASGVVLLGACAATPTHFYTLLPPVPAQKNGAVASASKNQFAIDVGPVDVPVQVDQAAWLVRTGTGEVAVLDNQRWAAPLGAALQSAFADAVSRQLHVHDVHGNADAFNGPVYRIRIDVQRFESLPGRYALIQADWSVSGSAKTHSPTILVCSSEFSQAVAPGFAALAIGHQHNVAAMSGQIAQGVVSLVAGNAACPQN